MSTSYTCSQLPRDYATPLHLHHSNNGAPNDVYHRNAVFVSRNHALRNGAEVFVYHGMISRMFLPVHLNAKREHLLFWLWSQRAGPTRTGRQHPHRRQAGLPLALSVARAHDDPHITTTAYWRRRKMRRPATLSRPVISGTVS